MDRNAQFEYISKKAGSFLTDGQPVISVDTKKKEQRIGSPRVTGQHQLARQTPAQFSYNRRAHCRYDDRDRSDRAC